jgi:alkanesulfonate monooxygenase SsuD/methylene tetrahydromethanopterin reductase-like flavin-dependent oxidoreductase (luciferase family)
MAAAVAGRTRNVQLQLGLMVLTLHDPLHAAEQLAVLDLVSNGRLRLIVGAGYRPEEFEQFGLDMRKRPSRMERAIDTLKRAWTGEPFEYEGRTVRIRPRPAQDPPPAIVMGGSSDAAAKRAARIADGFQGAPRFHEVYAAALAELGKPVPEHTPSRRTYFLLYVAEDVDAAWEKVGPHALHVNNSYAGWLEGMDRPAFRKVDSVPELRAIGMCKVVTPRECVEMARADDELGIQPLFGGLPPAVGWESLRLIEREVLPELRS